MSGGEILNGDFRRYIRIIGEFQSAQELENRSEEHTSELQSRLHLVCRLLLEKKKYIKKNKKKKKQTKQKKTQKKITLAHHPPILYLVTHVLSHHPHQSSITLVSLR